MSWIFDAGLFLSILPLFVLIEPRLRERKRWLFTLVLGAEMIGVSLMLLVLAWRILSPVGATD